MKKINKILALVIVSLIAVSCSNIKITADYEKEADFSQYKTFSFLDWQEDADKIINDMNKKRIRNAFIQEFKSRGIEYVESGGDLALSLYVVISKETSVSAYTNYYNYGGYGRYNRYGYGWGGGFGTAHTTYSQNDYLKGTMVTDLFDDTTGDQVWQGVMTGTLSENHEKREKNIPKAIKGLMQKYPVPVIKE